MRAWTTALIVALLTVAGCHRATAYRVLAASDVAADQFAAGWEAATDARIARCKARDLPTPAEREACLGPFAPAAADKAVAALSLLVSAQAAVKEAAACEERITQCAGKVDWPAITSRLVAAWQALRPLVVQTKQEAP